MGPRSSTSHNNALAPPHCRTEIGSVARRFHGSDSTVWGSAARHARLIDHLGRATEAGRGGHKETPGSRMRGAGRQLAWARESISQLRAADRSASLFNSWTLVGATTLGQPRRGSLGIIDPPNSAASRGRRAQRQPQRPRKRRWANGPCTNSRNWRSSPPTSTPSGGDPGADRGAALRGHSLHPVGHRRREGACAGEIHAAWPCHEDRRVLHHPPADLADAVPGIRLSRVASRP